MVKAPPSVSIQKWVIGRLHWNFPVHQTFGIKRFCNRLRIPPARLTVTSQAHYLCPRESSGFFCVDKGWTALPARCDRGALKEDCYENGWIANCSAGIGVQWRLLDGRSAGRTETRVSRSQF